MHEQRKKIWINRFQTLLFWRIGFYFVFYQLAVWALIVIERNILTSVEQILGTGSAANLMILLVCVVIGVGVLFTWDAVVFAHRIVGPLVRFRRACQAVRDGEEVELVKLRKDDMLEEFRDEFNEMLKALEERGAVTTRNAETAKVEAVATSTKD